ncbi:hypothetical protein RRG08_024738 [Elysia crispata]|uniref:Uncharacterized protein n=1 Tax=Elysia crispata TaxID=231223 RepID=A0AAE0YE15_9GAST|nr:hypothetical protein RRG08_024738 [Elysia crispata]
MRTLTIDRFLSRRNSSKSSSSSSNSSGSTTTISSTGSGTGSSAGASSSCYSSSSAGREFSGSNLILEDLSMFYLRQMASSLKTRSATKVSVRLDYFPGVDRRVMRTSRNSSPFLTSRLEVQPKSPYVSTISLA